MEALRRNRNRIELAVNYLATHSAELEAFQESRDNERLRQKKFRKSDREMRWVTSVASDVLSGDGDEYGVFFGQGKR